MNYYCYVFESSYCLDSVFPHLEEAKIGFGALLEAVRTAEMKPVMQQSSRYLTLALQRREFNREAHTENDASLLVFVPPAKRSAPGSVWRTSRAPLESGSRLQWRLQAASERRSALRRSSVPHLHPTRRWEHSLCFVRNERGEYSPQFARAETSCSNSTQPVVCKGREMLLLVVMAQISHLMS